MNDTSDEPTLKGKFALDGFQKCGSFYRKYSSTTILLCHSRNFKDTVVVLIRYL